MIHTLFRGLDRMFERIWSRKLRFFGVFMVVVTLTYAFLVVIDFIPEPVTDNSEVSPHTEEREDDDAAPAQARAQFGNDPTPDKIIFDTLDKEIAVLNPTSSSVEVLDNALLGGVVRHPESANITDEGTMFLFGHSSYLPVVHNKNFQAFNGIQNLEWGDKIRVQSGDFEYVYRVDRVYEVKATTAEVELIHGTPRLTLVTCNTFGSKEDRHVVEATLIDSYPL